MVMMNISIDQVAAAIISNNMNIPGGRIRSGDASFTVKSSGFYKDISEIENTVTGSYQGRIVFLKDIAGVDFDYGDESYIAKYNGHKAAFLTVRQKENINIFEISDALKSAVDAASARADQGVQIYSVFDQSDSVKERINGFLTSLWQGMVLVGLIIFLALGFRASLMVIVAVPLSIIIGLGFVNYAGFGLQQITIASLVVALGMLVDNSIIVNENIERFMRQGIPAKQASIEATNQLFWAVVASTVTTQLAFVPILMMPDETGEFIRSMPVTLIFTLLASLLIALIHYPIPCRYLL
jgi:multidrug efflux pump subunit AcrB